MPLVYALLVWAGSSTGFITPVEIQKLAAAAGNVQTGSASAANIQIASDPL